MDVFYEHLVKKKKDGSDYIFISSVILGAFVATGIVVLFSQYTATLFSQFTFQLWFIVIAAMWYGAYVLIRRRNIEYEYILTNGELDIDAIRARKKRYHVLTVRAKEFTICANIFDEKYKTQYLNVKNLKKQYNMVSAMQSRQVYFADFRKNGEQMRLLFEPPAKMVAAMKKYNPEHIFLPEASGNQ